MSKSIFKTTQYPIQTLINDIDYGKIALPDKFYEMKYSDFLIERRKLLSKNIRDYFESI